MVQKSVALFSTSWDESRESQTWNLKDKTGKIPLIEFQLFIFYKILLFTGKFSRTTIHPGIFRRQALLNN